MTKRQYSQGMGWGSCMLINTRHGFAKMAGRARPRDVGIQLSVNAACRLCTLYKDILRATLKLSRRRTLCCRRAF
ncbi:uncharacterized protein MYCFIDRAFT_178070 [Pseudocercospora fijiensis CIRAD86]|uniref:Uncharacterized protein n=1 Tax=Pseudocercospora fijiensis (strain CIRAD86) TaxID=383855 RepID=M3AQV9_PSEFD|nr:uncharacterized protein MYCFIDRAFT_178070 [Pseudocercospora fijiensis CIRAD86]EME79483.1 hypothetical protein MYCFIDRAFT_178070 [Pseudocercospora fijiensis CIRAD86]